MVLFIQTLPTKYFNTIFIEFKTNNQYGKDILLAEWMVLFVLGSEGTDYVSQIYQRTKKVVSCKYKQFCLRCSWKESGEGVEDICTVLISFLKYLCHFPGFQFLKQNYLYNTYFVNNNNSQKWLTFQIFCPNCTQKILVPLQQVFP